MPIDSRPLASSCFVVATRNRPDDLLLTVQNLLEQTVLPEELCIVDSNEVASTRDQIEQACEKAGLLLMYVHPAPPGLPRQRNIGIDRTKSDPIFFIDDDVRLNAT